MIQTQYFNFYGVGVRLRGRGRAQASLGVVFEAAQKRIQEDFHFFSVLSCVAVIDVQFLPVLSLQKIRLKLPRVFRTRMCTAYGIWGARFCDYGQDLKVFVRFRVGVRKIYIFGEAEDPIAEIALITLLSAVGEELDARGLHRIHALAFERDGKNFLMPLRSGFGKSSIAALMLSDSRYRVFSDEIPLLSKTPRGVEIISFPLRVALLPQVAEKLGLLRSGMRIFKRRIFPEKILLPIPDSRVAGSARAQFLILSAQGRLRLIFEIVLGWGVPQFAEYMIRLDNLPQLAGIALSRLSMALRLLISTQKIDFVLTRSPLENKSKIDILFE